MKAVILPKDECASGGILDRKERHVGMWVARMMGLQKKVYEPEFVGKGIIRTHGEVKREGTLRIHSDTGRGRPEVGSDEVI
jgi:hypothetical protein